MCLGVYGEIEVVALQFEAGANLYIVKPTEPDELIENIRMLLGR